MPMWTRDISISRRFTLTLEDRQSKECARNALLGDPCPIEIGNHFRLCNNRRTQQALGYRTPAELFTSISVEAVHGAMVESSKTRAVTAGPKSIRGPLSTSPFLSI